MAAIKYVEQLLDRFVIISRFLDALGASGPAKELRDACGILEPLRGKTLVQVVSPPPNDRNVETRLNTSGTGQEDRPSGGENITVDIANLYSRAGQPGLTAAEIERVFESPALRKLSADKLRSLAMKLDVAAGKLSKDKMISKMKIMVLNRAGTHARVNN